MLPLINTCIAYYNQFFKILAVGPSLRWFLLKIPSLFFSFSLIFSIRLPGSFFPFPALHLESFLQGFFPPFFQKLTLGFQRYSLLQAEHFFSSLPFYSPSQCLSSIFIDSFEYSWIFVYIWAFSFGQFHWRGLHIKVVRS